MSLRTGVVVLALLCFTASSQAQAPTAVVNGQVRDPSGAAIPNATVEIVNDATHVRFTTETNSEGIYSVPNLPPGTYHIQVSKTGFKTIIHPDVVLHVQDADAIGFTLPVGATSDTVTVEGGAPLVNTESAAVSTVVDQTYVKNMPLNGRSFQGLILLTAGVLTNSPQTAANIGGSGEFSVNGQRTESNYYSVDGVSANTGILARAFGQPSLSGSLPVSTTLGTTQGLVSVDALEEFRAQTSTYSAEYGRNPGGQFSFATRSGTNQWHGTAFDYVRNNVFDANSWFNDYFVQPQPALRQNDFGGTLGGPASIPGLYNGTNKTFFFFSYEGLRLAQPQEATISDVPTLNLRTTAPSAIQPLLNAFPLPCAVSTSNCISDLGNGLGQFVGTWSNPGSIDAYSIRLDHAFSNALKLFFRFSDTGSDSTVRFGGSFGNPANPQATAFTTRTYTFGATSAFSSRLANEFRLGYGSNNSALVASSDNFGGAKMVNLAQLQGVPTTSKAFNVGAFLFFGSLFPVVANGPNSSAQSQWNLVDTMSFSTGRHQMRFGVDSRRLSPIVRGNNPSVFYFYFSENSLTSNRADFVNPVVQLDAFPVYTNWSLFAHDDWRVNSRLNVSIGLRWEINPAPGAADGHVPYTVQGSSQSTLTLAARGTPLWNTTWFNFAPRLGAAYVLRNSAGWETVLRGGVGVFFDTGQQEGSMGYQGPGFSASSNLSGVSFPAPLAQVTPPVVNPPVPPFPTTWAFPTHLQLPYTLQWNVSVEQALSKSQALTVSYVGADGRRLLQERSTFVHPVNPNFQSNVIFFGNGLTSNYDALQVQFQRRFSHGLTSLASYTWSHAIDFGSQNASLPYMRGNSDFDVRHNLSGALSYDLPGPFTNGFARAALHHWGLDSRFTARTGFPVTLNGRQQVDPATHVTFFGGLNRVPNEPVYIYGSQCAALYRNGKGCPGGRAINPNAFALPASGQIGDAPRNFARGFGAWQMDLAVRRDFPIFERLKLQFRAEAFNVFNHPNFGRVSANYCLPSTSPAPANGCTFGQATQTLASSLGVLNPLYQQGGPRSMQLALKLAF